MLGIDKHASEEEIKKAYRKKALELHPDRNYGNVDKTTKSFAEVQSAYEILSDPQERAWYDSHRNMILRSEDDFSEHHYEHNLRVTTTEDIMKMLPKVNACRDFSDSTSSFYGLLRIEFDILAREEQLACEWENLDPTTYPGFGNARDQYDPTVRSFYAAWSSFATRKSFSWADIYRYAEAPDRHVRRLMEKENLRLREEAIREFNDAVRSLVAFVKKRDPRYKPSTQSEIDRQRALRDAAAAQAARSRAANQAKVGVNAPLPQWTRPEKTEPSEAGDSMEEEPKEMYECVVCNKSFKSEKQFEVHEKSKKHVKATQKMRREMQLDDENLRLATPIMRGPDPVSGSSPVALGSQSEVVDSSATRTAVADSLVHDPARSITTTKPHGEETDDLLTAMSYSKISADLSSTSTCDDDYANREDIKTRIVSQQNSLYNEAKNDEASPESNASPGTAEASTSDRDDDLVPQPKRGKAKAKREKKAAQKLSARASADTQLFNHITNLGHAQPVTKGAKGTKGGKGRSV
ncbi:MAG: hypothetical protein Q9211_000151 [Gyalolechia sp. 1 TL-2023]